MKFRLPVRKFALCLALVGVTTVASANSNNTSSNHNFNSGFLAAESGEYQKAANQWGSLAGKGHAVAQFNMGLLYHSGSGVELNEGKAVSLYHQAAENGNTYAQEYLAVAYQEGWFGLPKDEGKAKYWSQRLESGQ